MPVQLLALALLTLVLGFGLGWLAAPRRSHELEAARAELQRRDQFLEQLRELTWEHRELAPELSTIVLDEISTHIRQHRPLG
ncbi:hypothetical protein DDE18_17120 [Nocardioides gansuensis]|uniref:Uncharacterized protein n=1 Tax=Nocardioides gansuensis TaxID=2138300 RepID=A0A2T8F7L0_9ACTN|nr:hypothetical protein [Nocardioides gansuensis]PVG81704.1 hypothetical protein DDE18_17120 [Nocardioides gansuensis]